jgi:hypothetical protein
MEISFFPRYLIRFITNNSLQQINWNILLSSIMILLFFTVIQIETLNQVPHFCLIKQTTGYPCPGCGVTRSVEHLFHFRWLESIKSNPNGLLLVLIFIIQIPLRIIAIMNENKIEIINKISKILTRTIITTLVIFWIYQIINLKFY